MLGNENTELEKYQTLSKIGEGTYGVVFKAKNTLTNELIALKKIRLDHEDEGIPSTAVRQISLLKTLDHPNIIRLVDVISGQNKLYLAFEFEDCDLKKFMEGRTLSEDQVKKIIYQLLLGLDFCHSNRIVHRDLKPQNILINRETFGVKLADFGLARAYYYPLREYTHEIITLWYRAPQILLGTEKYSHTVDLWSVGCIFYQIAHKKCLFCGDSEIDQLFKIFQTLGTPCQKKWPGVTKMKEFKPTFPKWQKYELQDRCSKLSAEGLDLLKKMLVFDPVQRITCEQALEHPYFASINSPQSKQKSP